MNAEIIFWVIVVAGAVLIGYLAWPQQKTNVVAFTKPKPKKPERSHLDAVYNPKQYRRPRK